VAGVFVELHTRGGITHWHFEGADNYVSATTNATGRDTLIAFSSTSRGAPERVRSQGVIATASSSASDV
jgi:hypothetical protein